MRCEKHFTRLQSTFERGRSPEQGESLEVGQIRIDCAVIHSRGIFGRKEHASLSAQDLSQIAVSMKEVNVKT